MKYELDARQIHNDIKLQVKLFITEKEKINHRKQ